MVRLEPSERLAPRQHVEGAARNHLAHGEQEDWQSEGEADPEAT
jgi:hypothetical protein